MSRRLIALFFICPLVAFASPNESVIADLYARGLAGDKEAVVDCLGALEKVVAAQPNDQLARVYLGSAWTLRSRDLPFGKEKLETLRKGIALMDEAAAAAPDNARVQLIRAVTNEAFPFILGRRKVARRQLDELLVTVEKEPGKLKPADRQLLYLNAGEAAKRAGEKTRAAELWQRGAAINADPKLREETLAALAAAQN